MSSYECSSVYLHGVMRFRSKGYVTPVTLPADGILVLSADEAARVVLANGSVLKGIRITFSGDPAPTMDVEWDDDDACMLILCAEDGGMVTVVHNSVDVTDPLERINVSDGADTVIDNKHVQVFHQYVPSAGARRWRVNDWAGV